MEAVCLRTPPGLEGGLEAARHQAPPEQEQDQAAVRPRTAQEPDRGSLTLSSFMTRTGSGGSPSPTASHAGTGCEGGLSADPSRTEPETGTGSEGSPSSNASRTGIDCEGGPSTDPSGTGPET
ncbi:hypothetical protein AMECASPLE_029330 [Ameca splendens]|uniref:Uncharacterized protein n=1 Tax=Ameca splendens TaxID=208324 RepID=A0ABV0XUP0_9TELE